MEWGIVAIFVGACAAIAGAIAFLCYMPAALRGSRLPRSTTHLTTTVRLESVGQLSAGVLLWSGAALAQVGVVANDLQRGTTLAITLPAAAVTFLVCGVALGRLSLRLQLRLESGRDGNGAQA